MNRLCQLKGHMWYTSKRTEVERGDTTFSIPTEITCARCGETENAQT